MGREEEDDLLPLVLIGKIVYQRLPDVVRKGLDEPGMRSPAVDEAPFHRRRLAAIKSRSGSTCTGWSFTLATHFFVKC